MARAALVTGGTRGIGAAVSRALKDAGYRVAANFAGNQEAADQFSKETGIPVFRWDVGDADACVAGAEKVAGEVGEISVLVNNAGITRDAMFHKMTPQQWDEVVRVNLTSMFNMTRPLIEPMRAAGFGRIINISSINGQRGQMGQVNYSAAKAGVMGFTRALALETARKGITVNCIAPGFVNTDMVAAVPEKVREQIVAAIPVGHFGEGEDIARCVCFLADDAGGFITGTILSANGGQHMAG